MILRLLLLAGLAWLLWQLWRHLRHQAGLPPPRPQDRFEPMARCAQCGVHLPAAALSRDGRCGKCSGG